MVSFWWSLVGHFHFESWNSLGMYLDTWGNLCRVEIGDHLLILVTSSSSHQMCLKHPYGARVSNHKLRTYHSTVNFQKNVPWSRFWKIGNFLLRIKIGLFWELRCWHIWKIVLEVPLLSYMGVIIRFLRPIYLVENFQTSIKS